MYTPHTVGLAGFPYCNSECSFFAVRQKSTETFGGYALLAEKILTDIYTSIKKIHHYTN